MLNYESHLRIFREMRMFPWMPEHKAFIDAEIAKLSVLDPKEAEFMRKQYDEKMEKYKAEQKKVQDVVTEVTSDGEVTVEDLEKILAAKEPKEVEGAKKRGRKPKNS